ncbi:ectoine/hydroxyectoine ABC transporter substrate-binding protein EhuB [Amycolatopsis sp. WAC 01375]|uniref:ectoine/hydroxyectoine ABC transporter substrate-binding protein EhuB n=1 Tax=unclassified Amycolatopsis TaxID=2618356 RepID=UPI000F7A2825|nr:MULTISPECIES: ectoine/hydroxyectoine ABC transporter substrate-binding protein EhuB [unclassified Amycolatopsis]RSM78825.1 ectoine/hydroxyectoine ABC transporter substrate-binding protein EhuB [Amycolatopsis sp. WAC 01375]RSN32282.1 ectoine/hydroxyectoine ABC transporter substrate-binding protein EhuB [Amycolatopsis sp. WAC 01416]
MARGEWSRREFFRRSAVLGAVTIGGPVLLSACTTTTSGNALEAAKSSKKIKIGIANEAPYGFTDQGGKVTGEAPEVARAVFKAMGIDNVEAEAVSFDQLIPGLNARKYDIVAAGMNIKKERCDAAAFSIPDYSALTALLVPKGNPQQVLKFEDIAAKKVKVAVLSAAVEKGYATDSGVAEDQIVTLDSQDNMLRAVTDGRVYCAALTDISLKDVLSKSPGAAAEVTPGFDPIKDGKPVVSAGAFVFRKDDNPLREAFNAELKKLQDSGEWTKIVTPFGFTAANLPKPDVTTEKLCAV